MVALEQEELRAMSWSVVEGKAQGILPCVLFHGSPPSLSRHLISKADLHLFGPVGSPPIHRLRDLQAPP